MSRVRAACVVALIAAMTLVLAPLQILAIAVGARRLARLLPFLWHRGTTALLGLKVRVHGRAAPRRPLLLVSNHVSWLDITVLGSVMPLSFVSKAEVADWPVFGWFAKLQRSVFVERDRRGATGRKAREIAGRLGAGDVMVLFAEGTSSNGIHVLPFRTALLGAARAALADAGGSVTVQPVALCYTRLHGLPLGRFRKPHVAWYGDMEMAPHFLKVLERAEIDVDVIFLDPIPFGADADRKAVARRAEEAVRVAVGEATAGRIPAEAA